MARHKYSLTFWQTFDGHVLEALWFQEVGNVAKTKRTEF
jgi:hypothetical protein